DLRHAQVVGGRCEVGGPVIGPPAPKPPANNVSEQLQAVAAKLSQAAGVSAVPSCETPPQTPPPPTASPCGTGAVSEPSPANRSQLVDAVKKLEAALAAAPEGPGLEEARQHLQAQLDTKRKELGDMRPLGKRLDGAKAALERARVALLEQQFYERSLDVLGIQEERKSTHALSQSREVASFAVDLTLSAKDGNQIDAATGNTEALLTHRGARATACREARRDDSGQLSVQ
ncbi:unnamed protein product, partial [Prorocentrum cordatum]